MKKHLKSPLFIYLLLIAFYLLIHLIRLAHFPVFADESIYIRWTQLIMDDPQRYLFFPMNDGKTPLHMWLMVPFQHLFDNQLFAGRFVSVLAGLFQIFVIGQITKTLSGRQKTVYLSMILTTILPFWYFYHRMAMTDALLTLFVSTTVLGFINISKLQAPSPKLITLTSLSFFLAIMTKIPAVLLLPSIILYPLFFKSKVTKNKSVKVSKSIIRNPYFVKLIHLSLPIMMSLLAFFSLKLVTPSFGSLFSRGSDFLFPVSDVLLHGKWQDTLINIPSYFHYFASYMTWPVILLNIYGLFSKKLQKQHFFLILSACLFAGPIVLLGRNVFARYYMPVIIFLTVSAALALQEIIDTYITKQKDLKKRALSSLLVVFIITGIISPSFNFIYAHITDYDKTPFVSSDRSQYLEEWSSGHGITETVEYINNQAKDHSIAVATEGRFGTLPDGLLIYFHNKDVDNIYIDGIEEQPVTKLTEKFIERSQDFDEVILVVNSHRMKMDLGEDKLITEFCRPNNAPCLQIWNLK